MTEESIFARLQMIDQTLKLSYAEAGILALKVKTGQLFTTRFDPATEKPCESFSRWLVLAAPYSSATMFSAVRDVEELSDVPETDLREMPAANIHIVKQLSSAVRADASVLHAAKTLKSDELISQIQRDFPRQHLEMRKTLRFRPEESAAETIEQALSMAEARGAKTRDEQLESVAVEALQAWKFEDECSNLEVEVPDPS